MAKIDVEKTQEPKKGPKKKEKKELTPDKEIEQVIQTVLADTTIKPRDQVLKSWQFYNNLISKLKTAEEIQNFLEQNIKNNEASFIKHLEELPDTSKPTGNNDKEKMVNFLTNEIAETVIKTVFSYKLKDDTYKTEVENEMTSEEDDEKTLDEKDYPKQNNKYTTEAMIRYLYEKETGQTHKFLMKDEDEDTGILTGDKGH